MESIDQNQEAVNETSYEEHLLAKKKDPTKDPRWCAVHGLTTSIQILAGRISKGFYEEHIKSFLHHKKTDLLNGINTDKARNGK